MLVCVVMSQGVLDAGISSIAVVLKHAAIYPRHEQLVGQLAKEMGFRQVKGRSRVHWGRGMWSDAPAAL